MFNLANVVNLFNIWIAQLAFLFLLQSLIPDTPIWAYNPHISMWYDLVHVIIFTELATEIGWLATPIELLSIIYKTERLLLIQCIDALLKIFLVRYGYTSYDFSVVTAIKYFLR